MSAVGAESTGSRQDRAALTPGAARAMFRSGLVTDLPDRQYQVP